MAEATIPALRAPAPKRDNPLTRSLAGVLGTFFLGFMLLACIGTLPYTLAEVRAPGAAGAEATPSDATGDPAGGEGSPRYDEQIRTARHLPPWWLGTPTDQTPGSARSRLDATARVIALDRMARARGLNSTADLERQGIEPTAADLAAARPRYWMGSDLLGRSLLVRCLTGGGISLCIGIAAALLSVFLGTMYGAIAGYAGGRVDSLMMRIVDILYGLPYILLVVLLAVASESVIDEFVSRERARNAWVSARLREVATPPPPTASTSPDDAAAAIRALKPDPDSKLLQSLVTEALASRRTSSQAPPAATPQSVIAGHATVGDLLDSLASRQIPPRVLSARIRTLLDLTVLFVAIGGVSWLTMARVVRGQVLSLKAQPFMEAARAMGVPVSGLFLRHLLPNLVGPIIVYATLTVPQAILQESFLSFLGIGVRPPLPSWGNLAAEGLVELNPYQSRWWLLLFPCLLLGLTLLALNFVGEGLREALDPKRSRR